MSTPSGLGMRSGFDARKPLDKDQLQKIDSSFAAEKLKSPTVLEPNSPFITTDKHINQVIANQHVLDTIYNRLLTFSPPIRLGDHIVSDWDRIVELSKQRFLPIVAQHNTLDGIDFIVQDRGKLIAAIRNAKADDGNKGFVEGSNNDWKKHWALTLSFLATDGVGFREIFRPKIDERPVDNSNKMGFDSRFGRDINVDVSALHIAVSEFPAVKQTRCNIHIDQLTVTLGGIGGLVGISPSVINHLVNELLFKSKLKGTLPQWILEAFDISLMNPDEGFLRYGIGAKIIDTPNFKWSISYSAGLNNNSHPEWSGSFKFEKSIVTGISGRFNLGGG